ncbi:hypothetical protein ABIA19_001881 [Sinorhizobium fredii]
MRANRHLAAVLDVVLFRQSGIAQHAREGHPIELAVRAMKGGILADEPGEPIFGEAEIHVFGKLIESGACDELRIDLRLHAECAGLLSRERRPKLPGKQAQLALIGKPIVAAGDLHFADRHHRIGRAGNHQGLTAPHHEGEDENGQEAFDDPRLGGVSQGVEHGGQKPRCSIAALRRMISFLRTNQKGIEGRSV